MLIDPLVEFFESVSPETVSRIADLYAVDARFKDPFNDVNGVPAIEHIFRHMFTQVEAPRFVVSERIVQGDSAMLVWTFEFGVRVGKTVRPQLVNGVTHFQFNCEGKVSLHRDYWDTGEELYMKLPVLGWLLRALKRRLAA
ncbi:isomerase [Hydrogenophaga crassostreae]|uniref:Isomerase n=1 Tax=Hydrogenophaga crassostreae TaxID=1763535 RepID=A0A162YSD4_9BURK|nr:nuclear transport factor 2 family protein [Hydrogenophaga crassostreae]AOW11735.1 isomerase [Hydrogenophaga crassostreae]OAD39827.1 isomerase [Hydrogenophaga crassostreae]